VGRGVQNRLFGARKYHRGCQPVRDAMLEIVGPMDFKSKNSWLEVVLFEVIGAFQSIHFE